MDIILSTRNVSKAEQIKAILRGLDINLLTLAEVGIEGEAIEDGVNLVQNALKKATFAQRGNYYGLADDTGLFIDALDGKPGIHAARWAGNVSTEEIMNFTLDKLRDVPKDKRTASFKTVAVLMSPSGVSTSFMGEIKGKLLTAPKVACQPNMPYSALFVPNEQEKTWAEMSVDEENSISHRGKAFSQLRDFLQEQLARNR